MEKCKTLHLNGPVLADVRDSAVNKRLEDDVIL